MYDTYEAALDGDLEALKTLVDENPRSIHHRNPVGATPIMGAILGCHLDCLRYLLDQGADPRHVGIRSRCETSLGLAIKMGFVAGVQLLIEHGVTGNDVTEIAFVSGSRHIMPYVHVAILHDQPECLHVLLQAGGDPNSRHSEEVASLPMDRLVEFTSAEYAIHLHKYVCLDVLLEYGAKILTDRGEFWHHQPSYQNNKTMYLCFLKHGLHPRHYVRLQRAFLMDAVRHGDIEMVQKLLDAGADPLQVVGHQSILRAMFSFNMANTSCDENIIRICVLKLFRQIISCSEPGKGAVILAEHLNQIDEDNPHTILAMAITRGWNSIVWELLKAGADPNLQSANGSGPLIAAFACLDISSVVRLLRFDADPSVDNILSIIGRNAKNAMPDVQTANKAHDIANVIMYVMTVKTSLWSCHKHGLWITYRRYMGNTFALSRQVSSPHAVDSLMMIFELSLLDNTADDNDNGTFHPLEFYFDVIRDLMLMS